MGERLNGCSAIGGKAFESFETGAPTAAATQGCAHGGRYARVRPRRPLRKGAPTPAARGATVDCRPHRTDRSTVGSSSIQYWLEYSVREYLRREKAALCAAERIVFGVGLGPRGLCCVVLVSAAGHSVGVVFSAHQIDQAQLSLRRQLANVPLRNRPRCT